MAVGDIYRFTTTLEVNGEDCLNVDFKEQLTAPSNPLTTFELARDYYEVWVERLDGLLSADVIFKSVLCENLTDGLTFAQYDGIAVGTATGEAASSFVSAGIRLNRSTKLTRNGYKRIAGVSENFISDNLITANTATKDAVRGLYANTVQFDNISNTPDLYQMGTVIVGRTLNGQGVYEIDLSKINPVQSTVFLPRVTSQVSRKTPN